MPTAEIDIEEFRVKAKEWLAENAPRRQVRKTDDDADATDNDLENAMAMGDVARGKAFQAKLYDAGFAGITWPKEYGGQGLSNEHQRVFNEEASEYEMPTGVYTIGLGMVIPTMLEF